MKEKVEKAKDVIIAAHQAGCDNIALFYLQHLAECFLGPEYARTLAQEARQEAVKKPKKYPSTKK